MVFHEPIVRLEICSSLDMLELVQMVGEHVGRQVGLDEEALHWVTMAIRESVINAVKHGNHSDRAKSVFVEFVANTQMRPPELIVRVRDEGSGFDPANIADPLSPENMLKSGGRGVFLIRSFMDEVVLQKAPEGGMEVRMVKRVQR